VARVSGPMGVSLQKGEGRGEAERGKDFRRQSGYGQESLGIQEAVDEQIQIL